MRALLGSAAGASDSAPSALGALLANLILGTDFLTLGCGAGAGVFSITFSSAAGAFTLGALFALDGGGGTAAGMAPGLRSFNPDEAIVHFAIGAQQVMVIFFHGGCPFTSHFGFFPLCGDL